MDIMALIETQTDIFDKVCAHMKQKHGKPATSDEAIAVFNAVHNWEMNAAISRQQDERYKKKQQSDDEPPTAAQLRYAEDLEIEIPDGCTKKQLSKLINDRAH